MARRTRKETQERRQKQESREGQGNDGNEDKNRFYDQYIMHEVDEGTQKFSHGTNNHNTFRGQQLPGYFEINASETQDLKDGQIIGSTRFGQTLYWKGGQVVARG